jgi:iron only hydrogenase large subunit-like protein
MQKLQKVEITLADCLACSGCITSAESVLITQQSQEELLKILKENVSFKLNNDSENTKLFVFSVCQQSILSLAKKYHLDAKEAAARLSGIDC